MTDQIHVYALDPGKASGIVHGSYGDYNQFVVLRAYELMVEDNGQFENPGLIGNDYLDWYENLSIETRRAGAMRIILEDWTTINHEHAVDARWSTFPIGAVAYLAKITGVPLTSRRAGTQQGVTTRMLVNSGYWIKGGDGHMREALKHILQQLMDENHAPTYDALRPRS